jgi:hypothetical protein
LPIADCRLVDLLIADLPILLVDRAAKTITIVDRKS